MIETIGWEQNSQLWRLYFQQTSQRSISKNIIMSCCTNWRFVGRWFWFNFEKKISDGFHWTKVRTISPDERRKVSCIVERYYIIRIDIESKNSGQRRHGNLRDCQVNCLVWPRSSGNVEQIITICIKCKSTHQGQRHL